MMVNSARSFAVILVAMLVVLVSSEQVQAQRRPFGRRFQDTLKVGDKAPDFTLKKLDSKKGGKGETVTLSSFQGKKPVVLFFGSYT